jgi:hypothetical protein
MKIWNALRLDWTDSDHVNVHACQQRLIGGSDVLEGALGRLAVLDEETIRPILGMLSAIREYHRMQSMFNMRELTKGDAASELVWRQRRLDDACRNAAEGVQRLRRVADV